MVSYSMAGGLDRSAVANVTIDTPSIIFSLDPLFALLDFVQTPSREFAPAADSHSPGTDSQPQSSPEQDSPAQSTGSLAYRVNVVQASIKLLADPSRSDSEAIVLSIRQIQLAQQGTLVLSIDHLGIFLCRMDRQREVIRILDDFDLNLSMDNRAENGNQTSSIELDVQAIVVRLSNRDVFLVSNIVSRAIELSGGSSGGKEAPEATQQKGKPSHRRPAEMKSSSQALTKGQRRSSAAKAIKAEVLATKESVRPASSMILS